MSYYPFDRRYPYGRYPGYYPGYGYGRYPYPYYADPYSAVNVIGSQLSNVDQSLVNFGTQTGVSQNSIVNQLRSRGRFH
jgi:hypothetical protein